MKKLFVFLLSFSVVIFSSGCARIEAGQADIIRNFDKTVDTQEELPGSFVQTVT